MNDEALLQFLSDNMVYFLLGGAIIALFGVLLLTKRLRNPEYKVQPAAMTVALGVGIAAVPPVMLLLPKILG